MDQFWEPRIAAVVAALEAHTDEIELPANLPPTYRALWDDDFQEWARGAKRFHDLRLDWGSLYTLADYFNFFTDSGGWQRIAVLAMVTCAAKDLRHGHIGPFCLRQLAFEIETVREPGCHRWLKDFTKDELRLVLELFETLASIPLDADDESDERGYSRLGPAIGVVRRGLAERA